MSKNEKKKFNIYRIFNIKNLIILLVSLAIGGLIPVLFCLIKEGGFSLLNLVDGFFVSGALLIGIGLMVIVLNMGTFDIIAVGFSNLFSVTKKEGTKKYDGVYEYQTNKEAKRQSERFYFIPIVLIGLIYLIVSIILLQVFNSTI